MKILVASLFFLLAAKLSAQSPEEKLSVWATGSPIEKVYLHVDRDSYLAGETAWFKAYLYSEYQPDTISTSLYVELLNSSSAIINRKILPVFLGNTNGQIEIPDSLLTGNYIIRAYTPSMINSGVDFLYSKKIFVYGKKGISTAPDKKTNHRVQVDFFPEGGNLITGFSNTVAFKATDTTGLPVNIKGDIKNSRNEIVTSLASYHDGMGMFEFTPLPDEKYFAEFKKDNSLQRVYLPQQTDKGIAISVIPHPQGNFFEIKQRTDDPAFVVAYMIGQMQHHVVFKQEFSQGQQQMQGVINTQKLNSGILHITFFNKDGMPLAERLCFVNNREYIQPAIFSADTVDFSARSKNHFSIIMEDTVQANISVAVVDADMLSIPEREDNIISGLLLTSDLKGYIHNPAWFFSNDSDSARTSLDLVMMTHGWRRFKWTELAKSSNLYKDNRYITLAGKITLRDSKKPFADKQVLLMIMGTGRKRSTHFLQTDNDGRFLLDSLVFFNRNRLLFTDIRGRKSQYIDVYLDNDSLHRLFPLQQTTVFPLTMKDNGAFSKWQMDYDAMVRAEGILLEGVTVTAHMRSPLQELEERYTSGLFSGDANSTIDLVNANNEETTGYRNIFDYLQFRVPGLQVFQDGLDYNIFYRQVASPSAMGNIPMTLYLDEVETDASVISSIAANQVAMVKVFSSFAGAVGNAPGGVMAVYTKKGADYVTTPGFANLSFYNGYSVLKEFYSPNYSMNRSDSKPDTRITLQWRPDIFVNTIDARIPVTFFNNDRTKRFKIVVEGMTVSGKMICIEKIISAEQKGF